MDKFSSRRTPYNDSYETCEFTYVELRIYPDTLDPMQVTEKLGIEPTSIAKKGGRKVNSYGRERVFPKNGWFLSSEHEVSSKDVRRHLDWLLDKLEPSQTQLKMLQQLPGVFMSIHCIWWSAYAQGGPTLWPEQMTKMAEMNLELSFDISFYGPDEKEN